MRRSFWLSWLWVALFPVCCWAQVEDDFIPQSDFGSFQQQMNQRFDRFQDTINHRFAKELERQWMEYRIFTGEEQPVRPKPLVQPVAPPHHPVSSEELPVGDVLPLLQAYPQPALIQSPELPPTPQAGMMQLHPSFFSQSITCDCPAGYSGLQLAGIDEKSVATFWMALAQEGVDYFIAQCRHWVAQLHLNDWAVYQLSEALAQQLYPHRYNEQTVTTVFIVNQLGLKAKIGRCNQQLVSLLPVNHTIYSRSYLKLQDTKYYIFPSVDTSAEGQSTYTYSLDFPSAQSVFDMNIHEPLNFDSTVGEHEFSTRWHGTDISIRVNRALMDFYHAYPQVELAVYANAAPDAKWTAQMKQVLSTMLEGRNEYEAAEALLSFMHHTFRYANDKEQFGYEKTFFCEENFFYSGSDCEDFAVLFSYLVRELVGLDVVLLDYQNHIATAVHFHDPSVEGDFYMLNGKKYIVCDPTYFGASVGETMMNYKNVKARLIELKK